jgi:hypothetical protein
MIGAATEAAIRKALKKGDAGIRKIATTLGVGTGTVQGIKAELSPVGPQRSARRWSAGAEDRRSGGD